MEIFWNIEKKLCQQFFSCMFCLIKTYQEIFTIEEARAYGSIIELFEPINQIHTCLSNQSIPFQDLLCSKILPLNLVDERHVCLNCLFKFTFLKSWNVLLLIKTVQSIQKLKIMPPKALSIQKLTSKHLFRSMRFWENMKRLSLIWFLVILNFCLLLAILTKFFNPGLQLNFFRE